MVLTVLACAGLWLASHLLRHSFKRDPIFAEVSPAVRFVTGLFTAACSAPLLGLTLYYLVVRPVCSP
ncbi:MAG TPA: hypothetical protein VFP50_06350 [Anaeromyxobacteraceae bacterium]|nr:hypothetical protein [Anaeromyxobacteraceae bacterium]